MIVVRILYIQSYDYMINMAENLTGLLFFGASLIGLLVGLLGNLVVTSYFRYLDDQHYEDDYQTKLKQDKDIFWVSAGITIIVILILFAWFLSYQFS